MIYGYARVSHTDQKLDTQLDILENFRSSDGASVDKIVTEKITGVSQTKDQLEQLLEEMKPGDSLVVTRMDRLGRSTKQLLDLVEFFKEKDIRLIILSPNIDTKDEIWGKFFLTVMSAFSEMERLMIKEKTMNGIRLAKERGKYRGRVRWYTKNHAGLKHAIDLYKTGDYTVNEICNITKISRATFYRRMKEYES